jgi:hypothetical protein
MEQHAAFRGSLDENVPTMSDSNLEITHPSDLTDADWAEINRLRRIWETKGTKTLTKAFDQLDLIRCFRIMAALFPERVYNTIRDQMAEKGITEDDLKEMARKARTKR